MIALTFEGRDRSPFARKPKRFLPAQAFRAGPDKPQATRLAALTADAGATRELELELLWTELARGVSHVVDGFFCEQRCYLVVAASHGSAQTIEGRRLQILEAVLGGMRQKNIAIDFDLAPSTVALNSRLALESLGIMTKPSRAHPLLMLAARSAHETRKLVARVATFIDGRGRELRVISVPRPDRALDSVLPSAELAVVRSLIEGLSYQDIAQRRGTSTRTIANQISAVFKRLRISGRNELVQRLFSDEALLPSPPFRMTRADRGAAPRQTIVPPSPAVTASGVGLGTRRSA